MKETTYLPGQLVKYSTPLQGEESFIFRIIEDRGDRVAMEDAQWDYAKQGAVNPTEVVSKYDVCPVGAPAFTFEVITDAGSAEAITGTPLEGAAIFNFTFSNGVTGWAELGKDGFFCATVENQSECFATVADTAEWLYPRVSRL